jgi:hypothetical protein
MKAKVIRLAFLLSVLGFVLAARTQPIEAAFCCLDCIDWRNEYATNCVDENGYISNEYCNQLYDQLDFCMNVCTVSSCGNSNPGAGCVFVPVNYQTGSGYWWCY